MTDPNTGRVRIEVVAGVEGPSLYVNDIRVAGPKPWGGGTVTHTWHVKKDAFRRDIEESTESGK